MARKALCGEKEKGETREKENSGGKKRRKRRGNGKGGKNTHTCTAMHIPAAAYDTLTSSLQ